MSIFVRKKNAGHISPAVFAQAVTNFGTEIIYAGSSLRVVIADNALVTAALGLIESYSVNATDAIILSSAVNLAGQFRAGMDDLVLVASDQRLLKAAHAEGLTTFDPETQDQAALDALLPP
jgi:hypothetical protein